jgi:iron(III) transport system substrate-binding protein
MATVWTGAEGTGVGDLAVGAGLTQPYYTPMVEALPEHYRDPRSHWTSTRISYFSIAYNTRLVPPDQAPKSYDALTDPRWRGKLAWRIGTASGAPLFITTIRLARGEEQAAAFFRRLAAQKLVNFGSGSARTLVDRVIAGEFPIALNIFAHHPLISRAKGAPVDSRLMDPVPSTAGTMIIPKGVRHQYAALSWRTSSCPGKRSRSSPMPSTSPRARTCCPRTAWPPSSLSAPACRSCS